MQQRQRVGNQIVQTRVMQAQSWLCLPGVLLLAENVGDVIGAERTSRGSLLNSIRHRFGSVLTEQFQEFGKLPREGAIGIGYVA